MCKIVIVNDIQQFRSNLVIAYINVAQRICLQIRDPHFHALFF